MYEDMDVDEYRYLYSAMCHRDRRNFNNRRAKFPNESQQSTNANEELYRDLYTALWNSEDMHKIGPLIQRGVNIHHRYTEKYVDSSENGYCVIHVAVNTGRTELLALVVQLGANPDELTTAGDTILHIICKQGFFDLVEPVLKYIPNIKNKRNHDGLTALIRAVFHYGRSHGKSDEYQSYTHITYKSSHKGDYKDTIQALIKAECNVNIASARTGISPLHVAAEKCDSWVLETLLNAGAYVDSTCNNGFTPLLRLLHCEKIHAPGVKLLLKAGASVTNTGMTHKTALHLAVSLNNDDCVTHLLEAGANPNKRDNGNETPVSLAVKENNIKIVPQLLQHGGEVSNPHFPQNGCLLNIAIKNKSVPMVKLLLHHGATVHTQTTFGVTPLYLAADEKLVDLMKMLLLHNADMDEAANSRHSLNPQTPLQIAIEHGHLASIELLTQAGCQIRKCWLNHKASYSAMKHHPEIETYFENFFCETKSLQHLCRIIIRRLIKSNFNAKLELLVKHSKVPHKLADYIRMIDLLG